MAFDVKEYLDNRKKNTENGNNTSSGGFNAQDYLIKRKLPKVGEYLNSSLKSWNEKNSSAINEFNTRFKENKYRGDASDWYTDFGSRINELRVDADNIKSLIEEYKDYLGEDFVSSVTKAFDSNSINYSQMVKAAADDKDYWSTWDTEDAYNEYVKQQEEYSEKLNFDLEGGKAEIDRLQRYVDQWDEATKQISVLQISIAQKEHKLQHGLFENKEKLQQEIDAEKGQLAGYESFINQFDGAKATKDLEEKKVYYTLAERAQKAEELASVANPESKNYDPAFAEKSQYKSTATDAWHSGITTDFGMGYKDLTYEYINGDEDFRADVNAKHVAWSFAKGDTDSQYERAGYDHITEDEVALYNYYYNTSGKDKAEEYLDSIEEKLQTRLGVEKAEGVNDKLGGAYIFAVEAGLEQFTSGMKNMFSSEDYIPASATQVASGIVREGLADTGAKLPDWLGGASLGQAAYDVLNTTSNMLPSILTSTAVNAVAPGAGAVVGVGLMGTSAGGHAKAEMLNLGYSKEQANTYGIMVGAAEAGMEYLLGGITKLGGVLPDGITGKILSKVDNAIARTAIKVGGSMVSEGVEEGLQTVVETWLKEAATGVDWDAPNVDEVLYSSLLGALSAFGLEGAGVVAGEVGTYQSGKTIRNTNGGVGKLQEIGSKFASDTVAYKIASKVNAQTDAYTIGRLLNEVNGTISEQNVTEIANGLMAKGMDSKTANKLAKQYQAILNSDMNISDEAKAILNKIPGLDSVLRENLINKNTTVFQRTRAYSDLMNLADETANPKVDSLESLAQSMVARGIDSKYAGAMASGVKSQLTTSSSAKKVSSADADVMKRIASEVASGTRSSVSDTIKRNMDSKSNIAAGKLGVEGKYASSETGATRLASNKKKVNIVGINSIGKGTLKLKLDDGSIVDADEIDFSSSDEALVYEAVTNMGVSANTAWEILKGYNPKSGQSGTIYAMGALEAYTYGHNGIKVDGMSKDGFSALLTPTQKNTANKLGDIDARAKVEAQQKTIDKAVKSVRDEAKSKHKAIPRRKGETVFDGDRARLTDLQKSQLDVLEKVAEGLGVTFHIFESKVDAKGKRYYKMPNGKITSANGWYDPKTGEIWIDLHAGNDGKGTMIFTAAHELTHFIRQWSPAKFKVFADFLFEQYGKKGQDVNQLIRNQITKAANNGRSISWDEAYEEVIADSCETFLRDSKAAEKIAALREKDAGLANKIKSFLGQMLAKMRKVMSDLGLAPETDEGKMVAEMTDSIQKLYDLWTDALADAGQAYSTIDKNLMENGIAVNSDTESASLMSVRYLLGSNQQQKVAEELATRFGVTVQEAKGWIDAETSLSSIILNPKYSQYLDYTADENEEAIKSNSDYPQGTVDFSNICKKRRDFTEVMNRLLRNFPNHVFEATDLAKIRTIMSEEGMEVACGICYVEDRRQLDSIVAQNFIDSLALYRNGSKNKPDGTPFNTNQLKAFKLIEGDTYTPSIYELISLEGRNSLKAKNPAMEEAWVKFNNARGMQSVRLLLNDAEYKRQILKYSPTTVQRKNDLGGLRIYSFSDMEMFHLIDIIQVITDSATVGLSLQGYTKVNEYARAVKDTGEKLNRSLIPKGDLGYHIENGKVVLDYDTVEGIDINHPDFFDNIDNPNVGNIVIGINATQIKAAMTSKFIDQIIPFHTGQSNEVLGEKGIATWDNYKDYQSERDVKTGKKSAHQINIYTEVINAAEAEGHPITNKVEFVNKFLEVCKKNNLIPRFSDFLNVDENGDFVYTEGYHKFLVDFKTFDQNTGEYLPQKPVKPIFDSEYLTQLLKDYAKTQSVKDAKFAENMPKVLERITTEIVKSDGVKLSDRDSEGNTLSKEQQEFFKDSKVRWGERLMPVYHGTRKEFTVFDATKGYDENRLGGLLWAAKDSEYAADYTSSYEPIIMKGYLNITNPLDIGDIDTYESYESRLQELADLVKLTPSELEAMPTYDDPVIYIYDITSSKGFRDRIVELGYDGVVAQESGLQTFGFVEPSQFKNTTNKNPTSNPDVRFSDRSPESVSTRTILANALETTAQNDIERNKLELYKSKIDLIESEQAKLKEIKAELKELSFPPKGTKKDTARIKALRFEENETANRINTYDRQLLNLESTTALKNVLQREKDLVRKAAAQKNKLDVAEATLAGQMAQGRKDAEQLRRTKDAFAEYREKSEKTQREMADHYRSSIAKVRENAAKTQRALMDKNTESRKKAIESRNKTKMRDDVKKVVGDLKELLFTESKDKHVPIGLQKPVAEALDIINMDTMGADERVANYNAMIAKAKDPDIIAELTKTRDRIALQGANLSDKLTALKQAYAEIKNSDDPLIRDAHNEAIEDLIANTAEVVGNTSLRDMSYEQLEAVYDMYKAILATVRNANKLFKAIKQETITENSESVKKEVRAAGGHRERVLKATKWLKKFGWNMLKPIYAMKLIGSDTLTRLYENVRKGEDTWAVDVNEAKDFFKETAKKYEYNVWDFEKQYKFADSVGNTFSLTLEQIMSLYAYSKRSQADKHLEFGGFIFDDSIEVTKKTKLGIPMKYEVNDANPYRLKKEDLAKIIDLLESQMPNVKGFVDEMQAYLSDVMGTKGNEVSLAMYDIKLYKEQNYFPLKTARYFREFDPEKNGTPKIKNSGFSKKTVPQAGNPIILSNFMDVWANHVNDMSMYHSFVLPLEDFMRVYNYSSTAGGYDSVQQYIKNAYGSQANAYIETLMNDLNGGARSDPATDIISKGMSLFKKAAVFASASVVIQQPSAIARAMAYIDAKYFVDKPQATKHQETWAELKKYAPVAIIKEMGYFDTNMGRSTVDWIKEEKTWRDKVDDIASKAPAIADELAWCAIWKAVKREVASTTKLTVGSEAYLKAVGQRFTEVVTKTQVYDSVLSRSALMRSKDSGAKMVTAFMAEPTTSLNMVVDAIIEGKRGNKKFAKQAVGAVAASIILNSILVSLVTAARDDDEDETYLEKYLESLTAEMLDGFNPLTYIPLVKDIWSIMQGYDIERSDMSIWSDLWQSVENLFSDNKSGFEKTEGIVGSIASIFGLPAKNIMRDARAIYNLGSTLLSGTPTTWAGVGDAVGGAVKDSIPLYSRIEKFVGADESKADKLYDAIVSGDQNQIDRVKGQYKDDKAIESAIRQGLRENDSRIKEAAQARYDGDIEEYKRIAKEIIAEGHFSQDTVVAAINAEINAIKKGETTEEEPSSDTEKVTSIYKASDVNDAFESGDTEMALEVIEDLFNTKVANYLAEAKKDAEESGKRFNERTAQKEAETKAKSSIRTSMTTYWKPLYKAAYKAKDTAEQERIKRILKDSGMYGNAREVIETIREWRTERD